MFQLLIYTFTNCFWHHYHKVKEYEAPREDLGQKNGSGMKI